MQCLNQRPQLQFEISKATAAAAAAPERAALFRGGRFSDSSSLPEFLNRNVKMCGVHDAFALELNPNPIGLRSRKDHVELNLRSPVCDERMLVDHVDQICAGDEHVAPRTKILF